MKEQLDAVSLVAARATHEAELVRKELVRKTDGLGERIDALSSDVSARLRDQTLRGLPLAVVGLVLAGTGTVIQLAAALSVG